MIKALAHSADGNPVVFLGITGENMARLMADEPIPIDLRTAIPGLNVALTVVIMGGKSEKAIADQLTAPKSLSGLPWLPPR